VRLDRRRFLKLAGAAAVVSTAGYAVHEGFAPVVERVELTLKRLPAAFDGMTIAQLSDFHYDGLSNAASISTAISSIDHLAPDLIVLTGDFVTLPMFKDTDRSSARAAEPCAELLGRLRAPMGVVGVLGNHDHYTDPNYIAECLSAHNIRMLRDSSFNLEKSGSRLWIAGTNDMEAPAGNVDKAMRGIPHDETTVLLIHEPDLADEAAKHPVDLQLSGHSHGGQVRFPFVGAPVLPYLGRKYPWGLRNIGSMMLYTNRGIGTIRLPVRFFCPPEITLFTLRSPLAR
jgi:predicted MPP superfamily phosphohydrolase